MINLDGTSNFWFFNFCSFLSETMVFFPLALMSNFKLHWKGRLENAPLTFELRFQLLLPMDSEFATLLVLEANERVLLNSVTNTLAELRSRYWVV